MGDINYPNGDKYSGDSKGGKRSGRGKYTVSGGETSWEGTWNDDVLSGLGDYQGADGHYAGDFENSEKTGKGEFTWTTNDKYVGDWYRDTMNGEGQYFWPDGKVFSGFFRDGARNGLGVLKMPDGSKYEGEFKNDRCEGYGRFTDANGGMYEGEWKDNKKHGKGVYTYPDGRKFDGEFINDKKTSGYIINPDGSRIKVTFAPDGSIISQEAVVNAAPAPKPAPPPPPPADTAYRAVNENQTEAERQARQLGVASWLSLDQRGREDHRSSALAMSFGGEPNSYIRGGRTGVIVFKDRFKKMDDEFKATGAAPTTIPYEELRLPSKWNRPDIDPLNREIYLSDKEFQSIFKMDKEVFKNCPPWKKNQLKQLVKLY